MGVEVPVQVAVGGRVFVIVEVEVAVGSSRGKGGGRNGRAGAHGKVRNTDHIGTGRSVGSNANRPGRVGRG